MEFNKKRFSIDNEVMDKVRAKENDLDLFDRCLQALVCPKCGNKLVYTKTNYFSPEIFECLNSTCKFIHRRN